MRNSKLSFVRYGMLRSVLFCERQNWKTGSVEAFVRDTLIDLCFSI